MALDFGEDSLNKFGAKAFLSKASKGAEVEVRLIYDLQCPSFGHLFGELSKMVIGCSR